MTRQISPAGLDLIKQFEGCVLEAYQDVAGVWTIGYGHTKGVSAGMKITQAQADRALLDDLWAAQAVVDDATADAPTTDNQFGALVSLCFNIGSANFRGSSVLRGHGSADYATAARDFLMWNKAHINGRLQAVAGLTARRQAESVLYSTP